MTPPSFEHQKIFAMMHFKLGDTLTTIHDMLRQLYAEKSATKAALQKWLRQYRAGDESIKDKRRAGRPPSASVDANIMQVAEIVQSDPTVSVTRIAKQMNIGRTVVHKILTNSLGMQKVNDKWVSKRNNKRARDYTNNSGVISSVVMESFQPAGMMAEGDDEACDISEDDGGIGVDEQVLQLGDEDVLGLFEDHLNDAHDMHLQHHGGDGVMPHHHGRKRARFAFRNGVIEQIHDDIDDENEDDENHHAADAGHDELVEVLVFDPHVHGNLLNNADAFAELVTDDEAAQQHHPHVINQQHHHHHANRIEKHNHTLQREESSSLEHALHSAFLAGANDAEAAAAAVEAAVQEIAAEQLKTQQHIVHENVGEADAGGLSNVAVNVDPQQPPVELQHDVDYPTQSVLTSPRTNDTPSSASQIAYLSPNIMLMSQSAVQPAQDAAESPLDSYQRLLASSSSSSSVRGTLYSNDSRSMAMRKKASPKVVVSKKKIAPKPLIFVKRPGQLNVEPLIL